MGVGVALGATVAVAVGGSGVLLGRTRVAVSVGGTGVSVWVAVAVRVGGMKGV